MADDLKDGNIQVGNKKFGMSTKVTMSIKTVSIILLALLSALSTLATIGYFDIKHKMKDQTTIFLDEKQILQEKLETALDNKIILVVKDIDAIDEELIEMKGNIKVVLDRASGTRSIITIGNNITPTITPPTR